MKKEFITSWTQERVEPLCIDEMPIERANFFDTSVRVGEKNRISAITPDDMPFEALTCFLGKRTKVTIEVLPWSDE